MDKRQFSSSQLVEKRRWVAAECLLLGLAAFAFGAVSTQRAEAQGRPPDPMPGGTPQWWAEAAARNEVGILQEQGTFSVRYTERKIDSRGDTTRVVIESKQGGVARLIKRNGKPISAAEDSAERARLQFALDHPDEFLRHHRRDNSTRSDTIQLLTMMPKAMINVYVRDQPQPPDATSKQVVLDFKPDPQFHPPTMMSELLTGLEGRVWIDAETQRMTRIEAHVLHVVNFGFGFVARLYPGGTIEFEQTNVGENHWAFSHMDEHLLVRALMVKTMPENTRMAASDFEMLPAAVSYQDAIRMLLAMPLPKI